MNRRDRAEIAPGQDSPLAAAIAARDRETVEMVRRAVAEKRLRLAWQPVVSAADPPRVAFHEGLIRVLDETGRPIPARDFIGAVEADELGRLIDCAALDMGLSALARYPGLRVSVNMSARSVGYPRWLRILRRALAAHPTLGERLILEITESSAMLVPELVIAFMDEMQTEGICFALDDFGAGYTAFRYLKEFCFDIVKIDGQFVRDVQRNPDNQALIRALLSIGRHFDMLTVAEAVESSLEAEWLRAAGIGGMQGFLFGAPTVHPAWKEAGGAARMQRSA
ncbi:MAG: EAL domain-containing protein [Pseudorhodobacter sp.]